MNYSEFYKLINEKIKDLEKQELQNFINNILRKIPENKYNEIIKMLDIVYKDEQEEIDIIINNFKEKFKLINDLKLYFYADSYEIEYNYYAPYGSDYDYEYSDEDNIGEIIEEAYYYAMDLVNNKKYDKAKEIIDLLLYTKYYFYDRDLEEYDFLYLDDLVSNNLININVSLLCLNLIYSTYQLVTEEERVKIIYNYYTNYYFKNIKIEDSFNVGVEVLDKVDIFLDDWIEFLSNIKGDIEFNLIKNALDYTNYTNYKKYIKNFAINHPNIFIDIFKFLEERNNIEEIITIGNQVLSLIDNNLLIRNDILLFISKYDLNNKEKYIIEAFKSNSNIPNLLRIINNDYYFNNKNLIDKITLDNNKYNYKDYSIYNIINKEKYYFIKFFTGDYELFYKECLNYNSSLGWSNTFIDTAVKLWLLILNKSNSNIKHSLLSQVFDNLEFRDNLLFLDDNYKEIYNKWKYLFRIENIDKYITWLENIIDNRVKALLEGKYTKSYYKAAFLIVALGEVLESNKIMKKEEFINSYHKKYVRFNAFRRELKKYEIM